jgi:hypothetical protein
VRFSKRWLTYPLRFRGGASHAIASRYGRHYIGNPANFCVFPEIIKFALAATTTFAQCLDCNIETDLVAVLEASATVFAGQYSRTVTPSILWDSTPQETAASENHFTRSWGVSTRGPAALRSSAIQTSEGL